MFHLRPRTRIRSLIGTVADRLMPDLVAASESATRPGPLRIVRQQILFSRLQKSIAAGDAFAVEASLGQHWSSDANDSFYEETAIRNEGWYLSQHQSFVQALRSLNAKQAFRKLIEIGCGNGFVLDHLSRELDSIPTLIGLDINARVIERNRSIWAANGRLQFHAGEAQRLAPAMIEDGTLLLFYGGVLEYFSEVSATEFFALATKKKGCVVALVEPVDPVHDLDNDMGSHNYGEENSFSHNHAALLGKAGLKVMWRKQLSHEGVRWMMMLATA